MNKEYIYVDGKAIIKDENGNQKPIEYYDNLNDVLIQENLIETMEGRIAELEKESKSYKKYNRKHYIPTIFPMSTLMTTVGVSIMFYFLTGTNPLTTSVDTIFGVVNQGVLLSSVFSIEFLPLIAFIEFGMYRQHKDSIKKEKGVNSELEFLQKQIIEEKERLIDLKKDKAKKDENKEFRVVEVNDLNTLKTLRNFLNLYYDLGYNGEKYYKYYKRGKLNNKLKKYYNDGGIELVKEYLEKKGPTLVKKTKNRTNC